MTKIVNSAAGNSLYSVDGNAIDNVTYKPNILGGACAGYGNTRIAKAETAFEDNIEYSGVNNIKMPVVSVEEVFKNTKKNNKRTTIKTTKTKTGIKNNKYKSYSRTWESTYPQSSDDTSATTIASDKAGEPRIVISDGVSPDVKNV